jgi:hypothetical protein
LSSPRSSRAGRHCTGICTRPLDGRTGLQRLAAAARDDATRNVTIAAIGIDTSVHANVL